MRKRLRAQFTFERFSPWFYWFAMGVLRALLLLLVGWKVVGRQNVPRRGGLIIASNHLNNADPPILSYAILRRRIRWMAKVELFKYPWGALTRLFGAFPVRRFEADARALLHAERLLRDGCAIGMFPEGTRSRTGYLGKPHLGTGMVALRAGATVVPCAISGTEILKNPLRLIRRPRFTVVIGEPIQFEAVKRPTQAQVIEATERIFAAIRDLVPSQYHPPYTGSQAEGTLEHEAPEPQPQGASTQVDGDPPGQ